MTNIYKLDDQYATDYTILADDQSQIHVLMWDIPIESLKSRSHDQLHKQIASPDHLVVTSLEHLADLRRWVWCPRVANKTEMSLEVDEIIRRTSPPNQVAVCVHVEARGWGSLTSQLTLTCRRRLRPKSTRKWLGDRENRNEMRMGFPWAGLGADRARAKPKMKLIKINYLFALWLVRF